MSGAHHQSLDHLIIRPGETIRGTMARIEEGSVAIALMVDTDEQFVGTVSDGDVRRALLAGATMEDHVDPYVSRNPIVVPEGTDRVAVLDLMKARQVNQIPEVDERGRLLGLHVMHEVLGSSPKPNRAVILAGGRGSRLGPLTESSPKPMLSVAGRPILERLVLHLVGAGIHHVYLSVNYLADRIMEHFGDGSEFGCSIEYLTEDPERPLGTGGPLRLLLKREDAFAAPLLVMNGDLVASFSVSGILHAHALANAAITIALRQYAHDVPFGVAACDDEGGGLITRLEEKPRWVGLANAGIYVIEPRLLELIPDDVAYPITDLIRACLERGERVWGWELAGDWHDVGRPAELARARGEL